jgi:hypothetical protein
MEEIHRILKPDGIVKIWVPHYSSNLAFTNPDHKRFLVLILLAFLIQITKKIITQKLDLKLKKYI